MTTTDLCAAINAGLSPLFQCAPAPREGVLVQTPFLYPDGGVVEVAVIARGGRFVVTDHGEALGWLGMQSVRGSLSPKQRALVDDVRQTLGVELSRGRLMFWSDNPAELGEAVHLVGQAVVRVSDVWFTLRRRAAATIKDEVSELLTEAKVPFKPDLSIVGRSGRQWRIDYRTDSVARTAMVSVLTTSSRSAAHRITEHTLSGWVDLHHLKTEQPELAFVSLFDDTSDVWREEDFKMVDEFSEIGLVSHPDEFVRMLQAA